LELKLKNIKIESIEESYYEGDVFNLELKSNDALNDDLFWINGQTGIVTHNCFPKDLDAMIHLMIQNDIEPLMLEATREKNNKVRKNRDWEKMKGRAVSEN